MADLAALKSAVAAENHASALQAAEKLISSSKSKSSDTALVEAQHHKVVALIKLERYDDVLRVLAGGGSALEKQCVVEHAYALYKTGRLGKAQEVLQKHENGQRVAWQHIAAQVAYRAERFAEAARLYEDIVEEEGEDNDLDINLAATYAQLQSQGRGDLVPKDRRKAVKSEDYEVFELAYNAACGAIARGNLVEASSLLERAKSLCEGVDYLSAEEKQVELVPIIVQQIYVLARSGQHAEAEHLQADLTLDDIKDPSIKTVAENNLLTFHDNKNPYMIQRRAKAPPTPSNGNDRIFEYQAAALRRNYAVIDLLIQKFDGTKKSTAKALNTLASPPTSAEKVQLGVINAAATMKLAPAKEGLQRLLPALERRPTDVGLVLTTVQVYLQLHKSATAIKVLERFFENIETSAADNHKQVRFAPGLVALVVSLYRLRGRKRAIREELSRAATFWQKNSSLDAANNDLLKEAGFELLHSINPEDLATAGESFSQLTTRSSSTTGTQDQTAAAGLVAAYATTDYSKIEPYLSSLDDIATLTAGIDIDALVAKGIPAYIAPEQPQLSSKKRKRAAGDTTTTPDGKPDTATSPPPATANNNNNNTNNKKLKPTAPTTTTTTTTPQHPPNTILTKDGKPLDPERWLPLKDRSTYKPKNKKGKKRVAEATQGGMPVSVSAAAAAASSSSLAGTAARGAETLSSSASLVGADSSGSKVLGGSGGGGGGGNRKKKGGKR